MWAPTFFNILKLSILFLYVFCCFCASKVFCIKINKSLKKKKISNVEEGTSFSGRSTCPGCMRPWVQFLAPVNSNSKPQNVYLRKLLVLLVASLLLGLVMPACKSSTRSGGQDRGSQLRPAWAIEWRKKISFQKASKQIKKHCFPSKDSCLFQRTFFLVYVSEMENYSVVLQYGFSYRKSVPWNTSLMLLLARRPRIRMLLVRTELASIAFPLHEHNHSLSPGFFSFSLSSPLCYNTRFQVHEN